ncbi:hypothetical protein [Methylorubrum extorquens]|nr:hypothetical protein [Methylorubrum extorquens]
MGKRLDQRARPPPLEAGPEPVDLNQTGRFERLQNVPDAAARLAVL